MMVDAMTIQASAMAERAGPELLDGVTHMAVPDCDIDETPGGKNWVGLTETDVFRAYSSCFWYVNVEFCERLI